MSDAHTYTTPANFDVVLVAAKTRAAHDPSFAQALRNMIHVYGPSFAHGVLATLGLDRLGSDYAHGIDYVARLGDALPDGPATDEAAVEQFFFPTPSPARAAAIAHLTAEQQRLDQITRLVQAISEAGQTPDYDGAPS